MKDDWKKYWQFVIAGIISAIVSVIFAVLLSLYTTQIDYSLIGNQIGNFPESNQMYLPYEYLFLISFILFIVLTIVFYFVIGYLRKRKK